MTDQTEGLVPTNKSGLTQPQPGSQIAIESTAIEEAMRNLALRELENATEVYESTLSGGIANLLTPCPQNDSPDYLAKLAAQWKLEGARRISVGTMVRFFIFAPTLSLVALVVGLGFAGAAIAIAVAVPLSLVLAAASL